MKIKVKYDELAQTENICGNFVFIRDGDKIIYGSKVDFRAVREKINSINNAEELVKYWMGLKLSDKQANILKSDFAKRKAELGGGNGME